MDASFDFGGGWGETGNDFGASQGGAQRTTNFTSIPVPVTVAELCDGGIQEDKLVISGYSFTTVRIVGKVVTGEKQMDGHYEYEICDSTAIDPSTAPHFTVVRYHGIDGDKGDETFVDGTTVCVVGKLRKYGDKVSIIAFHLREPESPDEEQAFHLECKLVQLYYGKNIMDAAGGGMEARQYDGTIFTTELPGKPTADTPAGRSRMGAPMTAGSASATPRRSTMNDAPANTRGLTGQKAKIFDYIRRHGGEQGCHVEEIKRDVNADANFANDIEALVNEGTIYSSLDEYHYAIIE